MQQFLGGIVDATRCSLQGAAVLLVAVSTIDHVQATELGYMVRQF